MVFSCLRPAESWPLKPMPPEALASGLKSRPAAQLPSGPKAPDRRPTTDDPRPKLRGSLAGLLLAAGASARMGGPNKLLLPVEGEPLVRRPARALLEAGLRPVVVVVGRDAEAVRQALEGLPVLFAENPDFSEGMAGSLRKGVEALGSDVEAVAIALGDLPDLRAPVVRRLVAAFHDAAQGIVVPVHEGRRGHPVLLDLRRYRGELLALAGDEGARSILRRHPEEVLEVAVEDPGVTADVDTPEEYERIRQGARAPRP